MLVTCLAARREQFTGHVKGISQLLEAWKQTSRGPPPVTSVVIRNSLCLDTGTAQSTEWEHHEERFENSGRIPREAAIWRIVDAERAGAVLMDVFPGLVGSIGVNLGIQKIASRLVPGLVGFIGGNLGIQRIASRLDC